MENIFIDKKSSYFGDIFILLLKICDPITHLKGIIFREMVHSVNCIGIHIQGKLYFYNIFDHSMICWLQGMNFEEILLSKYVTYMEILPFDNSMIINKTDLNSHFQHILKKINYKTNIENMIRNKFDKTILYENSMYYFFNIFLKGISRLKNHKLDNYHLYFSGILESPIVVKDDKNKFSFSKSMNIFNLPDCQMEFEFLLTLFSKYYKEIPFQNYILQFDQERNKIKRKKTLDKFRNFIFELDSQFDTEDIVEVNLYTLKTIYEELSLEKLNLEESTTKCKNTILVKDPPTKIKIVKKDNPSKILHLNDNEFSELTEDEIIEILIYIDSFRNSEGAISDPRMVEFGNKLISKIK